MTFKDFLTEEVMPNMPLAQYVKMRCSAYLKIPGATTGMIFRGLGPFGTPKKETMNGIEVRWKVVTARKGRPPGDTPQDFSNEADKFFQEKFGWRGRADATFVSGSMNFAGNYGDVHIVIPMGETKFIWSASISDLYRDIYQKHYYVRTRFDPPEDYVKFKAALKAAKYQDTKLSAAIKSKNEIMLNCERYVAIDISRVSDQDVNAIGRALGFRS